MADASKGMDLFGSCDICARHDIKAVNLTGYIFPGYPNTTTDSFINRMKRYVRDRGMRNSVRCSDVVRPRIAASSY